MSKKVSTKILALYIYKMCKRLKHYQLSRILKMYFEKLEENKDWDEEDILKYLEWHVQYELNPLRLIQTFGKNNDITT